MRDERSCDGPQSFTINEPMLQIIENYEASQLKNKWYVLGQTESFVGGTNNEASLLSILTYLGYLRYDASYHGGVDFERMKDQDDMSLQYNREA